MSDPVWEGGMSRQEFERHVRWLARQEVVHFQAFYEGFDILPVTQFAHDTCFDTGIMLGNCFIGGIPAAYPFEVRLMPGTVIVDEGYTVLYKSTAPASVVAPLTLKEAGVVNGSLLQVYEYPGALPQVSSAINNPDHQDTA